MTIVVTDTTPTGQETARLLLDQVPSTITLRELIRFRVLREAPRGRAEQAAAEAVRAFERNAFFVFAGDRQIEDLDARLELAETGEVSFVRLVPLVGG